MLVVLGQRRYDVPHAIWAAKKIRKMQPDVVILEIPEKPFQAIITKYLKGRLSEKRMIIQVSKAIGKELEIRRVFSESHLYSSCFYIQKVYTKDKKIARFISKGAGWGHGVGMCQVGATVMALKGYTYRKILSHYFKDTELKKLY